MSIPDDILEVASRIVAEEGAEALTMERLARASGLSRATLYRQTGGREPVLDALGARGVDVGDRADPRARILKAARAVFGRAGFDAASVEEIADAANVGVVTVYRHFGDKEGLVTAFLDELTPRRFVRQAREAVTDDVRRDLETLIEKMLAGMREDEGLVRLYILESLRGTSTIERLRARTPARTVDVLAALLDEHQRAGRLRALDPRVAAQALGGMLFAFGVLAPILRGEPAADPKSTARALTDLFLLGAIPRKGAGR